MRKKILVLVDWYAPGFKAGGPIRSIVNFCAYLESEFDIYVLTTDRDLGDKVPYSEVERGKWVQVNAHNVFYAKSLGWNFIKGVITELQPDWIFLNSMFSRYFSIYPLLMRRFGIIKQGIVLAPRGMLKPSALSIRKTKKKIFIRLFKALALERSIKFLATDDSELEDIKSVLGSNAEIFKAGNLPGRQSAYVHPLSKSVGLLKMLFVGRIHPIKNLHFLLNSMLGLKGHIELSIIGTVEDERYWGECMNIINVLDKNIKINVFLDVPHKLVENFIVTNHIFALPTKGENFGHAIFEALALGRPVLISDQTPWRGSESEQAGWDLPLDSTVYFTRKIEEFVDMEQESYEIWSKGAWRCANQYLQRSDLLATYIKQFS